MHTNAGFAIAIYLARRAIGRVCIYTATCRIADVACARVAVAAYQRRPPDTNAVHILIINRTGVSIVARLTFISIPGYYLEGTNRFFDTDYLISVDVSLKRACSLTKWDAVRIGTVKIIIPSETYAKGQCFITTLKEGDDSSRNEYETQMSWQTYIKEFVSRATPRKSTDKCTKRG